MQTSYGTNEEPAVGTLQRLRQLRRRYVKKAGKRGIRKLGDFLGRQSLVGDPPVFETATFPFLEPLERNWEAIRAECETILQAREHLPPFQTISPDQAKIASGDRWKTYILYGFGYKSERNCARCPETTRLLETIPNLRSAWFSILSPGYHIPPHRGVTKGIIRGHLGLIIPSERERCTMRVHDRVCTWEEGKFLVFDDTYDHEVLNDTDEERTVLIVDFDRPMRIPGTVVSRAFLQGIRWTAYVQDARKNLNDWEDRFEAAVQRADAFHVDADAPGRAHDRQERDRPVQ